MKTVNALIFTLCHQQNVHSRHRPRANQPQPPHQWPDIGRYTQFPPFQLPRYLPSQNQGWSPWNQQQPSLLQRPPLLHSAPMRPLGFQQWQHFQPTVGLQHQAPLPLQPLSYVPPAVQIQQHQHWQGLPAEQRDENWYAASEESFKNRIKQDLDKREIEVELTVKSYKRKFNNLICWEEKSNIEILERR